jgi:AAA domain-containing protein
VIVLANHKGGVTKTTSTANLGAVLAEAGRRVLIVDCDPQANLSELFGWTEDLPGERLEDLLARPDAAGRYRQSHCNQTSGRSSAGGSCCGSSRPRTHSPTSPPTSRGWRVRGTRIGWRSCSYRCGSGST